MAEIPSSGPAGDMPFADIFDMDTPPRPEIPDGPVIVAIARDEMLRLPDFLRHHRAIGIRHFLIVDNGSTDGSTDYLDAQPDVTRFFSVRSFRAYETVFRPWLADTYGNGRWVLSPDVDEHFVYPGWPQISLDALLSHWERQGHDAVFAPMVDMYSDRPLSAITHGPEDRLGEIYSHFDGEGYWIAPRRKMKRWPSPPAILYGGARTRLDRDAAGHNPGDRLTEALVRRVMNHRDPSHPRPGASLLHRYFMKRSSKAGARSKVPLIRWRRGLRYPGSNHRVSAHLDLAPDWAALLHFRLMIDYSDRESGWDVRKWRDNSDRLARRAKVARSDLMWEGSRRFTGWRDLEEAGLIRASDELTQALGL